MFLAIEEIVEATNGKVLKKGRISHIEKIDTDSRNAGKESLFVPLKGETFDGHDFIESAVKNGAAAYLTEKEICFSDATAISVKDTRIALGDIAAYYISKQNPKRVAITGSVGKTTTKEMIAAVCENIASTHKTKGNFNNDIGVPLTAFGLNDEKIAIFEMGMNHFGEIEYLTKIVKPEISVITNIGYSHIENLGSREGILKAKLEIVKGMNEDGILVLNGDDKLLYEAREGIPCKVIYYGINNPQCDIWAEEIVESGTGISFVADGESFSIALPGIHNVYNALCAIAVGKLVGGSYERIKEGLMNFKPDGIRQNIVKKDGITYILDCYNAAPDSIIASFDVLNKTSGKRKIAVLGSVAELGESRDELLYNVGSKTGDYNINHLITVTEDSLAINRGARESGFLNEINVSCNKEAVSYIKSILEEGDVVLIKGSRKYKMEEIGEGLMK